MTGVELGRSLSLNASSVTELADRLEAARLVRRVRPAHDRRLVILQATVRGRRLVQAAYGPIVSELSVLVDGLDRDRAAIVTDFLRDVAAALEPITSASTP
jgi:DNA-binding MarR family transcriptional regulator